MALFGGDVLKGSCDGVEPRTVRETDFVAGFKEARLGLLARVLARSFAISRELAGLVLELAGCLAAEATEDVGLVFGMLFRVALIVDGRFVTVF